MEPSRKLLLFEISTEGIEGFSDEQIYKRSAQYNRSPASKMNRSKKERWTPNDVQ